MFAIGKSHLQLLFSLVVMAGFDFFLSRFKKGGKERFRCPYRRVGITEKEQERGK